MRNQVDVLVEHAQRQQQILTRAVPGMVDGRAPQAQPTQRPPSWGRQPTAGRSHSVVLASSDASDAEKRGADQTLDGDADQVQINEAAQAQVDVGNYGSVLLVGATFNCTEPIVVPDYIDLAGINRPFIKFDSGVDGIVAGHGAHIRYVYVQSLGGTAIGIQSAPDDATTYLDGEISEVGLFDWDTHIHLYASRYLIAECGFFLGGWGIRNTDGNGGLIVIGNQFDNCHGVYDEIGGACVALNRFDNHVGKKAVEAAGAGGNIIDGNWNARDMLLSSPNNIVRDNVLFGDLEVSGDNNELRGNNAGSITIDASADNTLAVLNTRGAFTDAGTGTLLNFDGSANDWNR